MNSNALRTLADDLTVNMFATRGTITEAHQYAMDIARATGPGNEIAVITAVHVLMNSIADELRRIDENQRIAAMRTYVASKLGDEVELSEELK